MSWITVGLAAAGATSGYLKGKRNEKNQEANAKFRKAAIQYSPWTKLSDPGAGPQGAGGLEAAIGGGMQGAAMGSMIGKAAPGLTASNPTTVSDMPMGFKPEAMQIDPIGGGETALAANTQQMDSLMGNQKYNNLLKALQGGTPIENA